MIEDTLGGVAALDAAAGIQERYEQLRAVDRAMRTTALQAVSAQTRPLFTELEEECARTDPGHAWRHDGYNFDGSCAWDRCVRCGAKEPADRHAVPATPQA